MAYQRKNTTITENTSKTVNTELSNESVNTELPNDTSVLKPRKYEKEDPILCKSITNGKLLITGDKSGILYRWADYGDVEEIEYQDLVYMIRSHKPCIFRPRIIIQDKEFLSQHSELAALYDSLYSTKDLKDILALPVSQMRAAINDLPDGALDAIKGVAASMVTSGSYDSVSKIKALDSIFGTNLLLTLAQR